MIKTSLGGGLAFIPFTCGAHLIAWNMIDPSVLSLLSSGIHELQFSLVSCIKTYLSHVCENFEDEIFLRREECKDPKLLNILTCLITYLSISSYIFTLIIDCVWFNVLFFSFLWYFIFSTTSKIKPKLNKQRGRSWLTGARLPPSRSQPTFDPWSHVHMWIS